MKVVGRIGRNRRRGSRDRNDPILVFGEGILGCALVALFFRDDLLFLGFPFFYLILVTASFGGRAIPCLVFVPDFVFVLLED